MIQATMMIGLCPEMSRRAETVTPGAARAGPPTRPGPDSRVRPQPQGSRVGSDRTRSSAASR
eukprot:739569-Hanusia_phi.AAC.2